MNSIQREIMHMEQVAKDKQTFADVLGTGITIIAITALILILGGF